MTYIPTLKTKYNEEIKPALMNEYQYKTVMQCPRLLKITLNQGLGKAAIADKKVIDKGIEEMTLIAGQKAVATKSKKDISNFKLRRGMPIGVRVTLRGERMYEFLELGVLHIELGNNAVSCNANLGCGIAIFCAHFLNTLGDGF